MSAPVQVGKVLFVCDSDRLAVPAIHLLRSADFDVTHVRGALDARTWLRIHRADVAIVDWAVPEPERSAAIDLVERLRAGAGLAASHVLVLAHVQGREQIARLFGETQLANFFALGADGTIDPVELSVTVAKILSRDIFGVARYVAPNAETKEFRVRRSGDKDGIVDFAEKFAREAGCHSQLAQHVAVSVDELVTNAVYNAPADRDGRPRYGHVPRNVPVELEPHEEVAVTLARDDRRVCVAARDAFGSLAPERVIEYLARCFSAGEDQIATRSGGAGLGLYELFHMVNSFVLNIAPGRSTECIGLFEISRSYRAYATKAKSFNIFVEGRAAR